MANRILDRLLFISVTKIGNTLGYVSAPDSEVTKEHNQLPNLGEHGVFQVMELPQVANNRGVLLNELL